VVFLGAVRVAAAFLGMSFLTAFFAAFTGVFLTAVFLAVAFLTGTFFFVVFDEAPERADVAFLAGLMGAGR
jgi:hypothetical protein